MHDERRLLNDFVNPIKLKSSTRREPSILCNSIVNLLPPRSNVISSFIRPFIIACLLLEFSFELKAISPSTFLLSIFIFTAIFLIYISLSPDMSIDSLKGVLVIGVTVGIIYGLVAVGISLIYTGLDVVNFSHGEFFMIGAFTGLTVYNFLVDGELIYAIFPEAYGVVGYVIGLFFAFVLMGLFGVLIERIFLGPLTKKGGGYTVAGMGIIICGFGLSVILQNIAYLIWNPTAHPFHADLGLPINIAGITLPMTYLWMLVTGFVVAGALYFFLNNPYLVQHPWHNKVHKLQSNQLQI